jgi:hypothetical protein
LFCITSFYCHSLLVISVNLISPLIRWSSIPKPTLGPDWTHRMEEGGAGWIWMEGGAPIGSQWREAPPASLEEGGAAIRSCTGSRRRLLSEGRWSRRWRRGRWRRRKRVKEAEHGGGEGGCNATKCRRGEGAEVKCVREEGRTPSEQGRSPLS